MKNGDRVCVKYEHRYTAPISSHKIYDVLNIVGDRVTLGYTKHGQCETFHNVEKRYLTKWP